MEIRVKKTVIIILVAALAVLAAVGTVIGIVVSRRGQNPTVTVTVSFVTNGGKEIAPITTGNLRESVLRKSLWKRTKRFTPATERF